MNYSEIAVTMRCLDGSQKDAMQGILSCPDAPKPLGVVVVVGGPQYRVGSHRQFLLLARYLAGAGYAVLRFDYRGMGDSEGAVRSFESIDPDIALAIDTLQKHCPAVKSVALWGLCDGASAALLHVAYLARLAVQRGGAVPSRLVGLCLLNPWVRSEASLARTTVKHYYGERLLQGDFWRKLARGRLDWRGSLQGLLRNLKASRKPQLDSTNAETFQKKMALAWRHFPGHILLILSGNDYTAKEFLDYTATDLAWQGLLDGPRLTRLDLAQADHTFSSAQWRGEVEQATLNWLSHLPQPG